MPANERTNDWQRPGALLRLHVRPAGRLLDQATTVHDADVGQPSPAAGHDLRPPVGCARRESGLVGGAISRRGGRGGRARTFSRRHGDWGFGGRGEREVDGGAWDWGGGGDGVEAARRRSPKLNESGVRVNSNSAAVGMGSEGKG